MCVSVRTYVGTCVYVDFSLDLLKRQKKSDRKWTYFNKFITFVAVLSFSLGGYDGNTRRREGKRMSEGLQMSFFHISP